jgi:DNA-binding winged helix-turn-helix (wHTH) protein
MPYFIIPFVLILIGLGTISAFWSRNNRPQVQQQLSEKINLAMRQTAHQLLKQAGDSISTIPPVKKIADNAYFLRIERHFNYDSLPVSLQQNFKAYGIEEYYYVTVSLCEKEGLVLGYSSLDVLKGLDVPCIGRNQAVGCYNFIVTFTDLTSSFSNATTMWLFLGVLGVVLLVCMTYYVYFLFKKTKTIPPSLLFQDKSEKTVDLVKTEDLIKKDETHLVCIGQSIFDTRHQILSIGNSQQKLTFREAKLLELFCHHKNELLERDFILKNVWEDEGVLVGRSVDVFVSRLRKILKNDGSLKITNVHSRGYRFEVEMNKSNTQHK